MNAIRSTPRSLPEFEQRLPGIKQLLLIKRPLLIKQLALIKQLRLLKQPLLSGVFAVLVACQATPQGDDALTRLVPEIEVDQLLVVDCLLPGQVRKLGSQLTFLTPRRPVKTTAGDCEIRGGEYVAFDRADYSTALRIWLPQAESGSAEAQTYVGEIYEKGLGILPDYQTAAHWYQLAANQGYSRAAINLGNLHEKGLGVEQDVVAALNWYRKASGVQGDELQYASTLRVAAANQQELAQLRAESEASRQRIAEVQAKLQSTRQQLQSKILALNQAERRISDAEAQLQGNLQEQTEQRPTGAGTPQVDQLLASQATLQTELARLSGQTKQSEQQRAELQRQLSQKQSRIEQLEGQLATQRDELARSRDALDQATRDVAKTRAELERQTQTAGMRESQQVATLRQSLQAQEAELQRLTQNYETQLKSQAQEREGLAARLAELKQSHAKDAAALEQAKSQQDQLQQTLIAREQELAALQGRVTEAEGQLAKARAEHAREVQTLARESQAVTGHRSAEIERLQQELESATTALTQHRREVDALRREAAQYSQRLSSMELAEHTVAPPSIEILEPAIMLTRGAGGVSMQASSRGAQTILGRVSAPAGLQTLTVNERTIEVGKDQLFETDITVAGESTPVKVVAIDSQGRRAVADFALLGPTEAGLEKVVQRPAQQPDVKIGKQLGNYYALVIGDNDYQLLPKLQTAENDAREAAALLQSKYGFKTTLLVDATRYDILSALNKLRGQLTENDNLLLYYAGHGALEESNKRGYWQPVDAAPDDTTNWISNVAITDILNTIPAKHIMVVADSCYSGTLSLSSVVRPTPNMAPEVRDKWIKIMANTRARTVLTSGGIRPVMDGGGGNHSVFAKAFLESLRDNQGILEGYSLFARVLDKVKARSAALNLAQIPEYAPIQHAGHEAGEFFFYPKG